MLQPAQPTFQKPTGHSQPEHYCNQPNLQLQTGRQFVISYEWHSKNNSFPWFLLSLCQLCITGQQAGKDPFLVELVHVIHKSKVPLMITGDFNMTRRSSDKKKPGVSISGVSYLILLFLKGSSWKSP
jgi:hypothetical protein